jgi:hypothetical protein
MTTCSLVVFGNIPNSPLSGNINCRHRATIDFHALCTDDCFPLFASAPLLCDLITRANKNSTSITPITIHMINVYCMLISCIE